MIETRFEKIKEALYSYGASDLNKNILENITLEELLHVASSTKDERAAFRAAWALEHVLLNDKILLQENQDEILQIYRVSNNWSVLRSISKMVMELTKHSLHILSDEQIELTLNKSFHLMENLDCPVAVRCNVYDILFSFCQKEKWVAQELTTQINFDLERNATPALLSRGKRILLKLERIS